MPTGTSYEMSKEQNISSMFALAFSVNVKFANFQKNNEYCTEDKCYTISPHINSRFTIDHHQVTKRQ
jgi:hypothetical protein